jgi:hypothetical protein
MDATDDNDRDDFAFQAILARLADLFEEAAKAIFELASAPAQPSGASRAGSRLRDPRPYETEADLVRERIRLERICAIHKELDEFHLDPAVEKLLDELGELEMANWIEGEDYMLRIAGKLCMEFEQPDLWCQIFSTARHGSHVDLDDEKRFLDHNFDVA